MALYFIKGDSPANWGATKLTLNTDASPAGVIAGMEKNGWKCVTEAVFNACRKKNSRPTPRALDGGQAAAQSGQLELPAASNA